MLKTGLDRVWSLTMRAQTNIDSGWSEKKTDALTFDLKPYDWVINGDIEENYYKINSFCSWKNLSIQILNILLIHSEKTQDYFENISHSFFGESGIWI